MIVCQDILIKNIGMPKSCLGELDGRNDCPWVGKCEIYSKSHFSERVNKSWNQRLEGCPLVEIPDNHGRIVDLDKVLDWIINEKRVFSMAMSAKLVNALSDAPVILEANND